MLRLMAVVSFMVASIHTYACAGGSVMVGEKVLLTPRTVSLSPTKEWDVNELRNNGSSVSVYIDNGQLLDVSVHAIKQDSQDIIFTIFSVKTSDEPQPRLIKVESNYKGNGLRSKGSLMSVEDIPVDETHGC